MHVHASLLTCSQPTAALPSSAAFPCPAALAPTTLPSAAAVAPAAAAGQARAG